VTWGYLRAVAAGAAAGLLLAPLGGLSVASAAKLRVSAAPIQTWKVTHGLPELPVADDTSDPTVPDVATPPDVPPVEDHQGPSAADPAPVDDHGSESPPPDTAVEPPETAPPGGDKPTPDGDPSNPTPDGAEVGATASTQLPTGP
jgi:hypothetical protein